jgi:tricorn protease
MLDVRDHAKTIARGRGPGYPQDRRPPYAWTKPIAVLCNEASYSNAQMFS